jgi:pilus assembly protein CpaF
MFLESLSRSANIMPEDLRAFLDHPGVQPIRHLLTDPQITEILINGPAQVYIERHGTMELTPVVFANDQALNRLIEALLHSSGRSVDASAPFADARLPDGSRVNVVIPPAALDGALVTIRKFTRSLREIADLVRIGTLSERMAVLLGAAVRARLNLVFSGASGTGKTTTLGLLSLFIPERERIVLIEDTPELELRQSHVVRMQCRPPNIQGTGEIRLGQLLRNAMRMRPTRIIVGEVRGDEAVEMIQAISSGHEGCLAVLHASSPPDAASRLEMMILSRGLGLPLWAIHRQIAAAINLIVQHDLLQDGQRKVTRITEVAGVKDDRVELRNLFEFEEQGLDAKGKVQGRFVCTGAEPGFLGQLARYTPNLPADLFKAGPA